MIRAGAGLYVASVAGWLARWDRFARLAWTAACLFYLAHVACAFHFYHAWSHTAAYQDTARRTMQSLGTGWGGGLYFNYAFTAVWIADVIWWWTGVAVYRTRPRWIQRTIHIFFAFMFFNATVIFGEGPVRWLGAAATVALGLLWCKTVLLDRQRKSQTAGWTDSV